jgi:hypothetical protein
MPAMRRILGSLALLLAGTALLSAADLTGKWKGAFDAAGTTRDIIFDLKDAGGDVTGTVGFPPDLSSQVKDGKTIGDTITFWFTTEYQGQALKLLCKGKIVQNEIRVTMGLEDGQWSTDFVVKKGS